MVDVELDDEEMVDEEVLVVEEDEDELDVQVRFHGTIQQASQDPSQSAERSSRIPTSTQ